MPYNYEEQKQHLFTDKGQREFLRVRDRADKLLSEAGAFMMLSVLQVVSGDSWRMLAYVDRLVELGEVKEITPAGVPDLDRVFVRN